MKKVLSLVLMMVVGLSLSACVQIQDEEIDCDLYPNHVDCLQPIDRTQGEAPGVINVISELPEDEVTTVVFWQAYGTEKTEALQKIVDEFEELHPNIKVEMDSKGGYDSIRSAVTSAIKTKDTPTLIIAYPDHISEYLIGNAVIPLDDFIYNEDYGVDLDDFYDAYLEENQQYQGGYMYSFPYSKSTEMMVYNKDVFEANGITVPTDGTITWDMLDTWAETLVGEGENQCKYLINYDSSANFFINNVRMWNGGYTNGDGEILVDNENTKDMLEHVRVRFLNNTMVTPVVWESEEYGSNAFKDEEVCMSVGSTAGINYNIGGNFEVGVLPIPQYKLDNKSAVQQGPNIAIMRDTTDEERLAAWMLIEFLTNAENTADWAMQTGYLPVRKSGYESEAYQNFLAIDSLTDKQYYYSQASKAGMMQVDFMDYDPAFAGAYTSSDARVKAGLAMDAVYSNIDGQALYTIDQIITDMLKNLGVKVD